MVAGEYSPLLLLHRVAIADAPLEKQQEIAKTVAEKKLTEKETKKLVEAVTSPLLTEEDRDAMLHDPVTRPYLRDEKGEKVQKAHAGVEGDDLRASFSNITKGLFVG